MRMRMRLVIETIQITDNIRVDVVPSYKQVSYEIHTRYDAFDRIGKSVTLTAAEMRILLEKMNKGVTGMERNK